MTTTDPFAGFPADDGPLMLRAADIKPGMRVRRLPRAEFREVAETKFTRARTVRLGLIVPDRDGGTRLRSLAYDPNDLLEIED
jgi:hypothetical protein